MNRLLQIGFECCGHWSLDGDRLCCELLKHKSAERVIYGFALDGEIVYIGKTMMSLERRMYGYQNPGRSQATNIRNHAKLVEALQKGGTVDIFALPDPGLLRYGDFRVNLAAGLEDEVISDLQPEWNISGRTNRQVIASRLEEELEEILEVEGVQEGASSGRSIPISRTRVHLGKTYFNQGFFNTGVETSKDFGEDGDTIRIHLDGGRQVSAFINRTSNGNGSPRIFGGKALREWFQSACRLDDDLIVEILGPLEIRIARAARQAN